MRITWHSIVLLPVLLLLPIVVTQAQTCSNGLAGYGTPEVCCPLECGEGGCGGVGCSQRPAGIKACCSSEIAATNVFCSESGAAPCIIDDADDGEDPGICSNGVVGYGTTEVCCPLVCGKGGCGGVGCSQRPGGKECCARDITATNVFCSDSGVAPCIIDGADDDEKAGMHAVAADPLCSNSLPGYQDKNVCCPVGCGEGGCGGVGCSQRPGGKACCAIDVLAKNVFCSVSEEAPCIIDDAGDDLIDVIEGGEAGMNAVAAEFYYGDDGLLRV